MRAHAQRFEGRAAQRDAPAQRGRGWRGVEGARVGARGVELGAAVLEREQRRLRTSAGY